MLIMTSEPTRHAAHVPNVPPQAPPRTPPKTPPETDPPRPDDVPVKDPDNIPPLDDPGHGTRSAAARNPSGRTRTA